MVTNYTVLVIFVTLELLDLQHLFSVLSILLNMSFFFCIYRKMAGYHITVGLNGQLQQMSKAWHGIRILSIHLWYVLGASFYSLLPPIDC